MYLLDDYNKDGHHSQTYLFNGLSDTCYHMTRVMLGALGGSERWNSVAENSIRVPTTMTIKNTTLSARRSTRVGI